MEEDPKAAASENGEVISHAADQGALLEELGGTANDTAHEDTADTQGNEAVKNLSDSSSN
jgi:hypothetical protein